MSHLQSYLLTNDQGMRVEIINFGARVKSILFPVNEKPTEMTVAYSDGDRYLNDPFYLGATCGRVTNRISGASFELNNKSYQLSQNDGNNCLHGGHDNFSLRFWQEKSELTQSNEVTLTLNSKDGDQGFPGNVEMRVNYHLSDDNRLTMSYTATTDKPTPINITNHSYFNLGEENCLELALQIDSASYLARDDSGLPTGEILPVANSDFCFNTETIIGERQNETDHPQLMAPVGYDHCLIFNQARDVSKAVAELKSHRNKVKMSLYTDQASMQLYTGSFLAEPLRAYQGVCLEAQGYSDAVTFSDFPSIILQAENVYKKMICYHFESY